MGFMYVLGHCYTCRVLFSFNANKVPSISIEGTREPICKDCMLRANAVRQARDEEPFWISPDAYEPQEVP